VTNIRYPSRRDDEPRLAVVYSMYLIFIHEFLSENIE